MLYVVICAAHLVALQLLAPPVAVGALGHTLPSRFPRCKKAELNTKRCDEELLNESLYLLQDGIPELGVPSIDPMDVTAIEVGESGGPVSLSVKFTNITLKGITNSKVSDVKFDFNDKTNMSIIYDAINEQITFESDYEMSGRLLLLPLSGKGRCKLTYDKMHAALGPHGKMITLKGMEYFNVTDFYIGILSVGKIDFHFDNLFNGDKNLGSTTLKLINDNWQQLWGELLPVFSDVFRNVFMQWSKQIFDKVPFDDIFLD